MGRVIKLIQYVNEDLKKLDEDYFEVVMNKEYEATSIRMLSQFSKSDTVDKFIYPNTPEGRGLAAELIKASERDPSGKNIPVNLAKNLIAQL